MPRLKLPTNAAFCLHLTGEARVTQHGPGQPAVTCVALQRHGKGVEDRAQVVAAAVKVGPAAQRQPELVHGAAHQRVTLQPVARVRRQLLQHSKAQAQATYPSVLICCLEC
jgi:hypothetical protein